MKKTKRALSKGSRRRQRNGQATTEYVVFMAMLVVAILGVGGLIRDKIKNLFTNYVSSQVQQSIFTKNAMHRYRINAR